MPETSVVPTAKSHLALMIGKQELKVPESASKFMLTKRANGYDIEEVGVLGESNVFCRRDGSGELSLIYKSVRLSHQKKEIDKLGSGDSAPWVITVPGYNKLNQIAGVYIATPQFIIVDGVECSNPYVQYENGEIKRIIARKIAIGYSPIGNLVAVDTVRHYNFDAYYLQDLHNKAKWKPNAAKFGTVFVCPFAPEAEVLEKNGASYVKDNGKVYVFKTIKDFEGIWIDPTDPEIRDVYSQHIQHQKFGDVIAQSLAARNALKAHPAIATAQVVVNAGVAEVMVFGWKHGRTQEQLQVMADKIVKGDKPDGVEVHENIGEASLEEVEEAVTTESDDQEVGTVPATAMFDGSGNETGEKANIDLSAGMLPSQKKDDNTPPNPSPEVNKELSLVELQRQVKELATAKGANLTVFCRNVYDTKVDNLTRDQLNDLKGKLEKVGGGKQEGGN